MSDHAAPFREVAAHFGLSVSVPSEGMGRAYEVVVLDGVFDGVPVHVYRATSAGDRRYAYVWVRAERKLPGDLGLTITRTNAVGGFFRRLFGSATLPVGRELGDPRFADAYAVNGVEPERVRALFTPELRAGLLAWLDAALAETARHKSRLWGLWADDEHVYMELEPEAWVWKLFDRTIALGELTTALRAVTSLARSFDAATSVLPPSPALAPHADAFRAFAAAKGLGFSPSPLRTWGRFADVEFVARAVTSLEGPAKVEVRRLFPKPLPFFLRLKPHRRFDFWSWDPDGPHERLGDAAFDDAYTILTSDLGATRALLTEPLRRALVELHAEDDVFVDPAGISVQRKDLRPETFDAVLAKVAAVEALV